MSFIPYTSVNPEDGRLPPLYFRPVPQRNLEAANIAHLPSAYVKNELRALRHRSVGRPLSRTHKPDIRRVDYGTKPHHKSSTQNLALVYQHA
jgi:hypothetical protein